MEGHCLGLVVLAVLLSSGRSACLVRIGIAKGAISECWVIEWGFTAHNHVRRFGGSLLYHEHTRRDGYAEGLSLAPCITHAQLGEAEQWLGAVSRRTLAMTSQGAAIKATSRMVMSRAAFTIV